MQQISSSGPTILQLWVCKVSCSDLLYRASLLADPLLRFTERSTVVADFWTSTGHDYLRVRLHRFCLADTDIYPLCQNGTMNSEHLQSARSDENYKNQVLFLQGGSFPSDWAAVRLSKANNTNILNHFYDKRF